MVANTRTGSLSIHSCNLSEADSRQVWSIYSGFFVSRLSIYFILWQLDAFMQDLEQIKAEFRVFIFLHRSWQWWNDSEASRFLIHQFLQRTTFFDLGKNTIDLGGKNCSWDLNLVTFLHLSNYIRAEFSMLSPFFPNLDRQ